MKKLSLTLSLLLTLQLFGQLQVSNNCIADIETIKADFNTNHQQISPDIRIHYPINTFGAEDFLSVLVKVNPDFNAATLEANNIMVGSRIGNIVSLKYPVNQLDDIFNMPGIHTLQVAGKIKPDLNKVPWDTRVDSVHLGLGLPSPFTGKDVLIGVTDWGFDYTHPMFYDTLLEETRIFAAWDQFKTSGPAPTGYDYGTEYTTAAELIAAGSDTANVYSYGTHGTHVAGIAGGSGAGTVFRGVAFESQFLFSTFLVDEGAVLDAWEWMYNTAQAEGKRLVINMSWGLYHTGALDGTSMLSEALDSYSDLGVLFVTSAGNNGNVDFHILKEFDSDTLLSRVEFSPAGGLTTVWGQSIHAWGDVGASFKSGIRVLNTSDEMLIESPWYNTATLPTYLDTFLVIPSTTDTVFYNLSMDDEYPSNGRPQMRLRVKKPSINYKIVLKANAESGKVHFWNVAELTSDVGNWGMPFSSLGPEYTAGDNTYGIGAPACTETAISVAAHSAEYPVGDGEDTWGGNRAPFSSIGPIMTEELKPDISAPGAGVGSSISSFTDASFVEVTSVSFEGRDYPFARFSGTSMSSPVVAGVSALILEANPYLSPWQVKIIIAATAREDDITGDIPEEGDHMWGYGKVNAYKAVVKALQTTGWMEIDKTVEWTIYPNPTSDQLNIQNLSGDVRVIQIYDLNGKLCGSYTNTNQISISHLEAGTYLLRIVKDNKVEQQKFIVQ